MKSQEEYSNQVSEMATGGCAPVAHIARYVECLLNEEEAERFESHVENCSRCRDAMAAVIESGAGPDWLAQCKKVAGCSGSTVGKTKSNATPDDETIALSAESSTVLTLSTEDLPPSGNERYRFVRQIGEGGMGVVWEGADTVMRRRVALKRLKNSCSAKTLVPRLLQEATSLARLSHPNIVVVFEVFHKDTQPTLVMEYVDGPALSLWRSGKILNERQVAALMEQLARAVQHAHESGVVHRDLKPSNILLSSVKGDWHESVELDEVVPKLSDFGLARIMDEQHLTQTGDMLGTPSYMAPEQTLGVVMAIGPAVDIYGLGAILYDLLTGTPPHVAQDPVSTLVLVRERDPVAPRLLRPDLSKDLETICLKCLQKSASHRYTSAADLAADLRAFLEGRAIKARPLGVLATGVRWCRRHKSLTTAIGVSVLLLLVLVLGSLRFAQVEHSLRSNADAAAMSARQSEQAANAEAKRANEMQALIKKNYDVSMAAVNTLVDLSGLGGEVVDLDKLRLAALREGTNVYQTFVDSLPDPEQWTQSDALALARFLEFAHRQPKPIDCRPWLEKLATVLDRLERENANSPDRYVARQKHAREMAIMAQIAGNNEDASSWWSKAGLIQQDVVRLDPENPIKNYQLAQAMMNAALYHFYCGRPAESVQAAEKSVAAYRKVLELDGQTDRHVANFVEKLYWQARFERENGNGERSEAIHMEALERLHRFPEESPYRIRLEHSKISILGK